MASFDFIDAAARGYGFVWDKRRYLMRVAVPVIFVKVICLLSVFVLHAKEAFLMQGLIMLPGSVLEAVFIVGLIRFLAFKEPIYVWGNPVALHESDLKHEAFGLISFERTHFMQAGIAVYLLIKITATAFVGALAEHMMFLQETMPEPQPSDISPFVSAFAFLFIGMSFVWLFKLAWMYIPAALGIPLRRYLKAMPGLGVPFQMLVVYLICFLPIMTVFGIALNVFGALLSDGSAGFIVANAVLEAFTEVLMLSVQAVAMAYGIRELLIGHKDS